MTHTPHELAEEFPNDVDRIHALKSTDSHFAKLFDAYHAVNRTVHRAEIGVEPVDDFTDKSLRKERLALKDEIAAILAAA